MFKIHIAIELREEFKIVITSVKSSEWDTHIKYERVHRDDLVTGT